MNLTKTTTDPFRKKLKRISFVTVVDINPRLLENGLQLPLLPFHKSIDGTSSEMTIDEALWEGIALSQLSQS
jgi:hypothetical protein